MDFDIYFEKLFNFYNVSTIKELSEKINIGASTISAWNQRKSITALKKACRELGIYNEIFGDNFNTFTQTGTNFTPVIKNEIKINDTLLEQAKNEASKFGLDISGYLEHLIIQDLKK